MLSADQYEVMYTLRSELFAKKTFGRCGGYRTWMKDATPAEREVLMKYRKKGARRGVFGGIMGALAMAGVWKIAALGSTLGIAGVIVGGLLGAWLSVRASRIRLKLVKEMLQLPSDQSPHAAQALEILKTKLPHNAYAQKLLKKAALDSDCFGISEPWTPEKAVTESSKDK
ncbi:hypothetical protein KRP22_007112 [Phytophthora ramorum]|nr:hypothetical protein KRP22_1791 [Phytophthora ramorum]